MDNKKLTRYEKIMLSIASIVILITLISASASAQIFQINTTPNPAIYLQDGHPRDDADSEFPTQNDVTIDMTDNNDLSRVELKSTANGKALALTFDRQWESGYTNVIIFNHVNSQQRTFRVQGYTDLDNITGNFTEITINGQGEFGIDVTDIALQENTVYNDTFNNFTKFRLWTTATTEISEVYMISIINDTTPPNITNCFINTTLFSCGETARFQCNITDESLVSQVTYTIDGEDFIPMKENGNIYFYDLTQTDFGNETFIWQEVFASDIVGNNATFNPNLNLNYSCQTEICTSFGECIDGERQCLITNQGNLLPQGLNLSCQSLNTDNTILLWLLFFIALVLMYFCFITNFAPFGILGSLIGVIASASILHRWFYFGLALILIFTSIGFIFTIFKR